MLDKIIKQADIAPIGSSLLNLPSPFSSIGIMHPFFSLSDDLDKVMDEMRSNIEQFYNYIRTYCSETSQPWC